jgi:undecaprenyl-diphosphatase
LLHGARIAHRHLSLRNVMLDAQGQPWIIGFAYAEAGASDRALARDVAELLASLSLIVDPQVAVDCALAALGTEALTAALPLLQPLALATTTRRALHEQHGRLDDVRDRAVAAAGAQKVVLEPLTRIRVHQLVMLGSFAAVFYLLLPQMSELSDMVHSARHAELGWLVVAVLAGAATFVGAALSLSGAVLVPLAFGRTFVTQLASSFSNKITPAGLGGMGVNVRYLVKSGVSKGDAVGAVALNGSVGFMVHIAALAIAAVTLHNVGLPHVDLPNGWILLIGFAALLSIVGVVLETSFGRKHVLLPTERTLRDLLAVVRRPTKAAQMFGGALLVLASYVVALGVALAAFHAHASWLDVTTVYLGGSAVASAAPTPGKVGAVEAALIAGLTGVGIASGPAVAGVLAFRLVTFWLPIAPGYLAFRTLSRRELL